MGALESVEHNLHHAIEADQRIGDNIKRVMGDKEDAALLWSQCEQQLADKQAYRDQIMAMALDAESALNDARAEYKNVVGMCSRFENDLKNLQSEIKQINEPLKDISNKKDNGMGVLGRLDEDLDKSVVEDGKTIEHDEQYVTGRIKQLKSDLKQIESSAGRESEKEHAIQKQEQLIKQRLETLDIKLSKLDRAKSEITDAKRSLKAMGTACELIEEDTVPRDVQLKLVEAGSNLKLAKADKNKIKSEVRKISSTLLLARGGKRRTLKRNLEIKKSDLKGAEVAVEKVKSELNAAKIDKKREPARIRAANKELNRIKEKKTELAVNLSEKKKQTKIAERDVESANKVFNEARAELGEIRRIAANSKNLDTERHKILKDLGRAKKNLEQIKTLKSQIERSDKMSSPRKNMADQLNGIEDEERELKTKLGYLKSEEDSILHNLEETRKELAEREKDVMEKENFLTKERSDLQNAEESVKLGEGGLKSAVGEVKTMDNKISHVISRVLATKSELATTVEGFERALMQELGVAQNTAKELEQLTRELEESNQHELELVRSELETSQNAANELEELKQSEIELMRAELSQTSGEDLERLTRELEESQNAIRELEESKQHEIELMRAELSQTSAGDFEQLTRKLETAQNEIIGLKSMQDPLLSELETVRKDLSDATMEIARLQETQGVEATVQSAVGDQDTKKLLVVLDGLLEHLSPDLIDKFANSDNYVLYEKVLDGYGV
ncbi:MAG: hypothetical protein EF813_04615 [Methanosarcinales archaeon]|nr:MAG: hypothetical protein EF813_04615 [Methanosarcinales archaeon]